MKNDPLAVLAAANPVPELPPVVPSDGLTCLRESPGSSLVRRRRRPRGIVVGAAGVASVVAVAVGLTLSGGSSGPGVNVAAAAYAATSAGHGVIEAEFVIQSALAGTEHAPLRRHREWLDAATGRRRSQTLDRNGTVASELATSPGWAEIWSSGPTAAGTIFRFKDQTPTAETLKPDGLALYRRLYEDRSVRVVGREALGGRLLWKLEGDVGFTWTHPGGRLDPIFAEVILVDPTTYLPVVEREVNLARPGHPTMIETRLVRYRRVPQGPDSEALVHLSAAHRGARIIGSHVFVPSHVARQEAEHRARAR